MNGVVEGIEWGSESGLRVRMPSSISEKMSEYARRAYPFETGGIIIGRYSDALDMALVASIASAPRDSLAGRTWFKRGTAGLERRLKKAWKHGEYYLGEWHSHPLGAAEPSGTDRKQLQSIAGDRLYDCQQPVLFILGGGPQVWAVRSFLWDPHLSRLVELPSDD